MERIAVGSSNVASVGYDAATQTLEVEFRGGSVYQYFDVPETIYEQFMVAESKGRYLTDYIKGSFRFAKT